jgi:hypothetical protein
MNQQPQFDPERSAAIRSILVETVASTPFPQSRPRRRTLVAIILAVVTTVLASGSIALALGGQSLFDWSASTPTPTPSATPAPTPTSEPTPTPSSVPAPPTIPQSIIPSDCAALLPDGTLQGSMAGAALGVDSVEPFTPQYASVAQAGVLQCQWTALADNEGGMLSLYVATGADAGRAAVDQMIADGAQPLTLGDAAAATCASVGSCRASIVVGSYWLSYDLRQFSSASAESAMATIEQAGSSFVSVLQQNPAPLPQWVAPVTPWATVTDCAGVTPEAPMADILGSPQLTGPSVPVPGTTPLLVQQMFTGLNCRWSVPDDVSVPVGQIRNLSVQVQSGAGWVEQDDVFSQAESTQVDVAGADSAYLRCAYGEGETCWLDVFVDDSWLQLGYGDGMVSSNQQQLTDAAAAIIARRPQG